MVTFSSSEFLFDGCSVLVQTTLQSVHLLLLTHPHFSRTQADQVLVM